MRVKKSEMQKLFSYSHTHTHTHTTHPRMQKYLACSKPSAFYEYERATKRNAVHIPEFCVNVKELEEWRLRQTDGGVGGAPWCWQQGKSL